MFTKTIRKKGWYYGKYYKKRKKLELIYEFAKTTPTIINGSIRKIDRTNLTYIEKIKLYKYYYLY